MNKILLSAALLTFGLAKVQAQVTVIDTVAMGAGYANNVWYSLSADERGTQVANNWDIALAATTSQTSALVATAIINPKTGSLYYATGYAVSQFTTLTTFDSNWAELMNSPSNWANGAFNNAPAVGSPQLDFGYGAYNQGNHSIEANKIFVYKYANGTYKKLYITLNTMVGTYTLRHANLDNTDDHTETLTISNFAGKNFLYFSLTNNASLDREPASSAWDLEFVQYKDSVSGTGYQVTGVLHNVGVKVAEITGVDETSYEDYQSHASDFSSAINTIGYNWKTYSGGAYVITDDMVYFVKDKSGNYWKLVFTEFISASGKFIFSKKQLSTVGIQDIKGNVSQVSVYPNPSNGATTTLLFSSENEMNNVSVNIVDMAGRIVSTKDISVNAGFNQYQLSTGNLNAGVYFVQINAGTNVSTHKLIKQ